MIMNGSLAGNSYSFTFNHLLNRMSTGWVCGVHPDFTELEECLPTMLDNLEKQNRTRKSII